MSSKYLFLDFDGVLNNISSINKFGTNHIFDPENIKNLNFITNSVDSLSIIISSNWRLALSLEKLKKILLDNGFNKHDQVIDTTTLINKIRLPDGVLISLTREQEILHYVSKNKIENYVILDDNLSFLTIPNKLVQTVMESGLTKELAILAIDMLT